MSASNEWAEYHLTPRGWEEGSVSRDFQGVEKKEPPPDRAQTVTYHEHMGSTHSSVDKWHETTWESDDKTTIAALRAQFGEPPKVI